MPSLDTVAQPPLNAVTGLAATTATGDTTLFNYTGSIRILSIGGVIKTTAMAAAQTRLKLQAVADALTATDLCAAADVTGDAAGTSLTITGTLANALVETTDGVLVAQATYIDVWVTTSGIIKLNNADAANAGRVFWSITYLPLTVGARVTAAF